MVKQIALLGPHIRVRQRLVELQGFRLHPLSVFPVESLLRNFADIDFWIEVGGKSLVMVAGIAVNDIEIVDFVKMMFGCVCRVYTGYSRVESAAEDGSQSCLFKTLPVGPLP